MLKSHVVKTDMDGITILLDTQKNEYYALNDTAVAWISLVETGAEEYIAYQTLANQYEVPIHQIHEDISIFLNALKRKGWIE